MSVRIVRKEETRNTTVWQFFAVAILPLLLAYFGGIATGKTSQVENKANEAEMEKMKTHIVALQDSLRAHVQIMNDIYAMQQPIQDEVSNYIKELDQAYSDGSSLEEDPGKELMEQVGEYIRERKDTLDRREELLKDRKLHTDAIGKLFLMAQKILALQKSKVWDKRDNYEKGISNSTLSEKEEENQQLQTDLDDLKIQMRMKELELLQCKSEAKGNVQTSNQNGKELLKVAEQSKNLAKDIQKEVDEIRKSILPNLRSGPFGNKKEVEAARKSIDARVNVIGEKTTAIINL